MLVDLPSPGNAFCVFLNLLQLLRFAGGFSFSVMAVPLGCLCYSYPRTRSFHVFKIVIFESHNYNFGTHIDSATSWDNGDYFRTMSVFKWYLVNEEELQDMKWDVKKGRVDTKAEAE